MPSLAVHDVTLINPGLLPRPTLLQLPGAFGINRNPRSASPEMAVRFRPFYTVYAASSRHRCLR